MKRSKRRGMVSFDALLSGTIVFVLTAAGYFIAVRWANGYGLFYQVAIDISL